MTLPTRRPGPSTARGLATTAAALTLLAMASPARAWLLPEHARMGRAALDVAHPVPLGTRDDAAALRDDRATLEGAWRSLLAREVEVRARARPPWAPRLCPSVASPAGQDVLSGSLCVDLPVLAAIAGDFSCGVPDLARVVLETEWLGHLLEHARETEALLRAAKDPAARLDAWHGDHIGNFAVDPDYLARASGNLAHFAWPRAQGDLEGYLADALSAGRPPNALAFYAVFHGAALREAAHAHTDRGQCGDCAASHEQRALLAEALALHYLEDSFSAGHFVGRFGSSRTRAGTHDYYCQEGATGQVWLEGRGEPGVTPLYVAHGDAFAEDVDVREVALAVRRSLHHLAKVLRDGAPAGAFYVTDEGLDLDAPAMNPCGGLDAVPAGVVGAVVDPYVLYTLLVTLQPQLTKRPAGVVDAAEQETTAPVFATEMGMFLGVSAAARAAYGQYVGEASGYRWSGTMDLGLEAGLAVDGITTSRSDGQLSVFAGGAIDTPDAIATGPAQPGRVGLSARLRAPFRALPVVEYVVPIAEALSGDTLAAKGWFVQAADRGLWGLERLHTTAIGTLQIIAGREVGYRFLWGAGPGNDAWNLDVPLLEYKPPAWYAGSVGNSFSAQLGFTLESSDLAAFGIEDRTLLGGFVRVESTVRRYTYP